jgi:hypothetical protein
MMMVNEYVIIAIGLLAFEFAYLKIAKKSRSVGYTAPSKFT